MSEYLHRGHDTYAEVVETVRELSEADLRACVLHYVHNFKRRQLCEDGGREATAAFAEWCNGKADG